MWQSMVKSIANIMTPENDVKEAPFNNPMSLKGIHNCRLHMGKMVNWDLQIWKYKYGV